MQDVGCLQDGPLNIDIQNTWKAYETFHQDWASKVVREAQTIRSHSPDLIISNISHLAIEAGAYSGIPTMAIASLSWDKILEGLQGNSVGNHMETVEHIRRSYCKAEMCIRICPSLEMDAFSKIKNVGPIALPLGDEKVLKSDVAEQEDRVWVLVGFGGIPLKDFPFGEMEKMKKFRFIVDGKVPTGFHDIWPLSKFPLSFKQLLSASDIIVTKPGYGTVIESVNNGKPIVYVRRYNFADEPVLIEYLHKFGRGEELTREDFFSGNWAKVLESVWASSLPNESPPPSGVDKAVEILMDYLS